MAKHLNINEIFGPTIQGEGPHAGQLVGFLRVAGCNLTCSWCDTPYSWDWEKFDRNEESHKVEIAEIADQLNQMGINRLILTGGEPLLQQHGYPELFALTGLKIDIETNGTRVPKQDTIDCVDLFCVSPKLAHAGDPEDRRVIPEAYKAFSDLARQGKAIFKFVAEKESDLDEVQDLIDQFDIPKESVWIMPEGITIKDHVAHLQALANAIVNRGWNLSTRIHVLAWEEERGR